jgi:RNA polymerase sigma factor (sigma-70 family)
MPASPSELHEFEHFYRLHADAMLVFFVRRVFDPEVALDLTAETFAQAYMGRKRVRGASLAEAGPWLYGIARHMLASYYRRGAAEKRALRRLGVEVPALADHDRTRLEAISSEVNASLTYALEALSPKHRKAVELRVIEELTYSEVAARLRISEVAARARVSRALRALADQLAQLRVPEQERP